jgi:hypothetical protein
MGHEVAPQFVDQKDDFSPNSSYEAVRSLPLLSSAHGAEIISPMIVFLIVTVASIITEFTLRDKVPTAPSTLKKIDGNSLPICIVLVVKTPSGNVNPHHPMLKGNLIKILANAKNSQTSPNPHMINAISSPTT